MKSLPITKSFSFDLENYMGEAQLSDHTVKMIEEMISSGQVMSFAVSFIGEPDENGTYRNVELLGLSAIPARINNG